MKKKMVMFSCIAVLMLFMGTSTFAADKATIYEEIPGLKEFSGQMIARPVQEADWMARGMSKFKAEILTARGRAVLFASELVNHVPQTDEFIIRVPKDMTENSLSRTLMATGLFQYVEPDWILYPLASPNDPGFGNQWHHDANRMNSAAGWDVHTGDPSVSVGICDTGVLTSHEDLQLHRLEGYNAVDQQWESQGGNIGPVHNHGTRCTGCTAGNGNNGVGISGVGWNLSHRMLRVSNSSSGSASMSTLQHAARTAVENGNKVASVSYSGVDSSSNLTTATYVKSQGGLLVWAAGNDGRNLTYGDRDNDDIIVVGATDSSDGLAYFSAYGQFVDLTAPGVSIYTTSSESNSTYAYASGTSFATPLTAGLVALIWSHDPSLTPDEVEAKLKDGCDDLGSTGVDNTYGYGRIDVHGALEGGGPPPPPEYPTISGNNNYEYIARAQIGGIDNTSADDPGGYGDYTGVTTDLTVGDTVNCTLTPGFQGTTYDENWKVWIDFNDDKDFDDAGEEVFYVTGGSSSVSGTITVPVGTAPVTTRMRVVMKWNGTPPNSGDIGYGEAEDYTVNIVEGGQPDLTPPNPDPMTWATVPHATGQTSISMTATTATDPSGVEYYFDCLTAGGHDSGWQDGTTYEDTGLSPNTTYTYTVTARDKSPNQNETGASSAESATTDPGGGGWVELTNDDFESGWGSYQDGGSDCRRRSTGYSHQGSYCADIQDNSGTSSSFYSKTGVDVHTPGYTQIEINFWFVAISMDNSNEDFWVQYYDGSTWHTVASFAKGIDFENNYFYNATVTINESSYNFPTDMKLRFMCDASGNRDDVYIDEIVVSAQ